jgi:cysteinyl-tRNA synthetase
VQAINITDVDDKIIARANAEGVSIGLGRIVALDYRSSTLYQIHEENRCRYF